MELEKTTILTEPSSRRRYDDACGTAYALDLIGERWALLVMRELMFGPKRFSDLRADLPGISANVLTQRLEGLEAIGVLRRRRLAPPGSGQVYELTPWGYGSEPIIQALGRWAVRSPGHDATLPLSAASLMMSLRTMIDKYRAEGLSARVGFDLGRESYVVGLAAGQVEVERGDTAGTDLTFRGAPRMVAAVIYSGQAIEVLEGRGLLVVEGDRALARRFVTLFPLPAKVEEA